MSNLRKQRGYAFESHIVEKFKEFNWESRRLGSPSTELPDVMAVNNFYKEIVAVEAKSTTNNWAYVPADQIQRCIEWVKMLQVYDRKTVILAFKFPSTWITVLKKPVRRKLRYFFKVFPFKKMKSKELKCNYEGEVFTKNGCKILLEDFKF